MAYPTNRRGELQTENCFVSTQPQTLAMTRDNASLLMLNQRSRTRPIGMMREGVEVGVGVAQPVYTSTQARLRIRLCLVLFMPLYRGVCGKCMASWFVRLSSPEIYGCSNVHSQDVNALKRYEVLKYTEWVPYNIVFRGSCCDIRIWSGTSINHS